MVLRLVFADQSDQTEADESEAAIAKAVTPWNRACDGQRSLNMCESFQSAETGPATVTTLASVSRLWPRKRPRCVAVGIFIGTSGLPGWPTFTLLPRRTLSAFVGSAPLAGSAHEGCPISSRRVRIFIAGASGLIGIRLAPLLVAAGHVVAGMTRTPGKAESLSDLGVQPVVCDVFNLEALTSAVAGFGPEMIFHQLTDLPDAAADLARFRDRNDRMRGEGTRNILAAAAAAGSTRVIAQSISWELPTETRRAATAAHEQAVCEAGGVVVRYGQFWGPGTYYETVPPDPPRIHVDDAARLTVPVLGVPAGLTVVIDDRAMASLSDAERL